MLIAASNTYSTSKARNADYISFMAALRLCDEPEQVDELKGEYLDMFAKLREEQILGYDWHGYDYLEAINDAIRERLETITMNNYFINK